MANFHALSRDQQQLALDCLIDEIAKTAASRQPLVDRRLNVSGLDCGPAALFGEVICFDKGVADVLGEEAQLARISGEPCRTFDNEGHSLTRKRFKALAGDERRNDACIVRLATRRAFDVVIKVGQYLEMFAKLGVKLRKKKIEQPVAEQDYFDFEWNWVRVE